MKNKILYIIISIIIHIAFILLLFFIIKDNHKKELYIDLNTYKENSIEVEFSSLNSFFNEEENYIKENNSSLNQEKKIEQDLIHRENHINLKIENKEKDNFNNLIYKLKTEMDLFDNSFSNANMYNDNFKKDTKNENIQNLIKKIEKEVNKIEDDIILNHDISKKIPSLYDKEKRKYVSHIRDIIYKNWNQNNGKKGWHCRIQVYQDNNGNLVSINTIDCPYNELFNNSIIEAIKKSEPFPLPENKNIFDNLLDFYFVLN